jgi:hypothetical protein
LSFDVNSICNIGNTNTKYMQTVRYGSIPENQLLSSRVYPSPAVTTP